MLIRYTNPPPPEKRKKCRPKTFRTAFSREPSFPRKQKTKIRNLKFVIPTKVGIQDSGPEKPFYPISSRTDRSGFPPARE
ncbi:hypothetical protein [Neisseria meningitidis]|uniref:hypothetical protein n=1 Tax=Neisseria meningitidis TaxID=487 RepID=UPI00031844FD|nr:hypothetical protein [Neisseria meningitidis]